VKSFARIAVGAAARSLNATHATTEMMTRAYSVYTMVVPTRRSRIDHGRSSFDLGHATNGLRAA
jgi:hypothetical protein